MKEFSFSAFGVSAAMKTTSAYGPNQGLTWVDFHYSVVKIAFDQVSNVGLLSFFSKISVAGSSFHNFI